MLCSSSTIFTSAGTQSDSTGEEETLEQLLLPSTLKTHLVQRVLWEQSCGSNRGKLDENMQRNIDQKEQCRRNNDVGAHHDVAVVRHFSDTIQRPFCALAEEKQRELIKTVATDWSNLSVRGSCLLRLARRRTRISSIKFVSLCATLADSTATPGVQLGARPSRRHQFQS